MRSFTLGNNPKMNVEVNQKLFKDVDVSFAHEEGEGDLSLAYWRKEHERFFRAEGTFEPGMEVYCQRFKVIEVLPLHGIVKK